MKKGFKMLQNLLQGFKIISNYFGTLNIKDYEPSHHLDSKHCVKSVRIRSYSGPHFPAFGLNTEYVSLHIQSECGKMRTGITPNTDTFHAVQGKHISTLLSFLQKVFK